MRRTWSLHFLCPTCRDELPKHCWKCAEPLDGRAVCRHCGHRRGLARQTDESEEHDPKTAAIPF